MTNTRYTKAFVVDTNIILNDANSLVQLSNKSENLIILPETVLNELDEKKSGFDEINYQAREFGRMLDSAVLVDVPEKIDDVMATLLHINHGKDMDVLIVSKDAYECETKNHSPKTINDRKIIEIANWSTRYYDTTFLSMDVMARNYALSFGLVAKPYNIVEETDIVLYDSIEGTIQASYDAKDVEGNPYGLEVIEGGKRAYFYRVGNMYQRIDESMLSRQNIKPKNVKQKIYASLMLDETYDVVLSDSPAGSGKTLIALSCAMRLLDRHKDKYDKIVYIRKTVLSDNEELGFLPGSLEEKMSGFLSPLFSNLEYIAEKKAKKKMCKTDMENSIGELMDKYNITSMYQGHLRGTNIRNAIIIWDEAQNNTVADAKTILTRVSEDCKVFVLGSTRQIDNKFTNRHNNALTYLLDRLKKDNGDVRIGAINLDKTERSKIAEWADTFETR